jgi:hypothetical protein
MVSEAFRPQNTQQRVFLYHVCMCLLYVVGIPCFYRGGGVHTSLLMIGTNFLMTIGAREVGAAVDHQSTSHQHWGM